MGGGGAPEEYCDLLGVYLQLGGEGGSPPPGIAPPTGGGSPCPLPSPPREGKALGWGRMWRCWGCPPPPPRASCTGWHGQSLAKGLCVPPPPASPSTSVVAVGVYGAGGRWDPIII